MSISRPFLPLSSAPGPTANYSLPSWHVQARSLCSLASLFVPAFFFLPGLMFLSHYPLVRPGPASEAFFVIGGGAHLLVLSVNTRGSNGNER